MSANVNMLPNGSWSCSRCTLENSAKNTKCALCNFTKLTTNNNNNNNENIENSGQENRKIKTPKPPLPPKPQIQKNPSKPSSSSKSRGENGAWDCYACSYRNENESILICQMCDAPKLGSRPRSTLLERNRSVSTGNLSDTSATWQCPNASCGKSNAHSLLSCSQCSYKRKTWNCPVCTLENAIGKPKCQACETKNPTRPTLPAVLASSIGPQSKKEENDRITSGPFSPRIESNHMDVLQQIDEQNSQETLQRIVQFCREAKSPFVDDSFPPTNKSLGNFTEEDMAGVPAGGLKPINLVWLRPQQIMTKDGLRYRWAVFRNPDPTDIEQGVLGNCWFLSALAVIAERPEILEKIVLTKQYCPEGVYQIRLCVDGRWQIVTIDDLFPCHGRGPILGSMAFSVARRNQLWVPLIEKALAKVVGGYATLRAGRTLEGLGLLTGAPSYRLALQRQSDTTAEETAGYYSEELQERCRFDSDLVWASLLSAREARFLMGCSCGSGAMDLPDKAYEKVGLLSRHAYSLLDVKAVDGARLVKLRNPWGQFVWKGAWSKSWPQWTVELKRQLLGGKGEQSGIFWMPFEEFCFYFDSVDICKVRPTGQWSELRLPGVLPPHWLNSHSQATRLIVTESTAEVCLSLFQQGARSDTKDQLDLLILVVEEAGNAGKSVGEYVCGSKRSIGPFVCSEDTFLKCGSYLIICCSFNHWGTDSTITNSVLAVHSSRHVFAETINVPPKTISDALVALVLKWGKRIESAVPGAIPRYLTSEFSGLIIVVDNITEDSYLQVRSDCSGSLNVVSTRGSLLMIDCIPPLHRQILVILSHMEASSSYTVRHRISHRMSMYSGIRDWAPSGSDKSANHYPVLNRIVYALHAPRPLFC